MDWFSHPFDTDPRRLLTLDDVTIAFHRVPVLDGVTTQIEGGERIDLLGRTGAGETTLLQQDEPESLEGNARAIVRASLETRVAAGVLEPRKVALR